MRPEPPEGLHGEWSGCAMAAHLSPMPLQAACAGNAAISVLDVRVEWLGRAMLNR